MIGCLISVLLVSSCGWSQRLSYGGFEDRAREVAARWQGSADDRAWREGFVLLEAMNPQGWRADMLAWVNRSAQNGKWLLETELPARTPAPVVVRWPDGSVLKVPLVTPASAYAEFSRPADFIEEECPAEGCSPLRVTGVELGAIPLKTSRGTIEAPAWLFSVKGTTAKY